MELKRNVVRELITVNSKCFFFFFFGKDYSKLLKKINTKLIYIVLNPAHVPCFGMSTPTKNRDSIFWTR